MALKKTNTTIKDVKIVNTSIKDVKIVYVGTNLIWQRQSPIEIGVESANYHVFFIQNVSESNTVAITFDIENYGNFQDVTYSDTKGNSGTVYTRGTATAPNPPFPPVELTLSLAADERYKLSLYNDGYHEEIYPEVKVRVDSVTSGLMPSPDNVVVVTKRII